MQVLLIDDEADICSMVAKILAQKGVECDCSHFVEGAREKLNNRTYQLYLIDINLPDGTGFELIPLIYEKDPGARVVIISAHDDQIYKELAASLGVEDFIRKPFSKNDILSLIPN